MRVYLIYKNQNASYEMDKNVPADETFVGLVSFATSQFNGLPESIVFSLPSDSENYLIADPQSWSVALSKCKRETQIVLTICEEEESDEESYELVGITQGVLSASEESEGDVESPIDENEQLSSETKAENSSNPEPEEEPQENELSFHERVLAFVNDVGVDTLKNTLAVAHLLIQNGSSLVDAVHTAIGTTDEISSHPFVVQFMPIFDVQLTKMEPMVHWIKNINMEHLVSFIPKIVDFLNQTLEGQESPELDVRPILSMLCPQMIQNLEAMIPNQQERVFEVDPSDLASVFTQAEEQIMNENPDRVRHSNVTCDVCEMSPIVGPRFKCMVRPDYDLCETCEQKDTTNYPFMKLSQPLRPTLPKMQGLKEFFFSTRSLRQAGFAPPGCPMMNPMFPCGRQQRGRGRGRFRAQMRSRCPFFKRGDPSQSNAPGVTECPLGPLPQPSSVIYSQPFPMQHPEQAHSTDVESTSMESSKADKVKELVGKKIALRAEKAKMIQQKRKIKMIKREAKLARKELKKMRKSLKKNKHTAKVVDHLDTPEISIQQPGTIVLKTWKVQNTGAQVWKNVLSEFVSGDASLVLPGNEILNVETTEANGFAYVRTILKVPETPGRYSVVYKLNVDGKRFGEKLRSVIEVMENQDAESDSDDGVIEDYADEVHSAVESDSLDSAVESPIPVPDLQINPAPVVEPIPAVVVEPSFAFQEQFEAVKALGFKNDDNYLKAVIASCNGDVSLAVENLLQ